MTKTKTNKPIKANDVEMEVSTNAGITPLAHDDIIETSVKYKYPEQFEQVDDQHERVPGMNASTSGAWLASGKQAAMNRAPAPDTSHGYAYADDFGSQEMNRKQPDKQVHSMDDSVKIGTGSLGSANKAAAIAQRKAIGTASMDFDDQSRN
jgi:hypothetical protein